MLQGMNLVFKNTLRLLRRDRMCQIACVLSAVVVWFVVWWTQVASGNFTVKAWSASSEMVHLGCSLLNVLLAVVVMLLAVEVYRKEGKRNVTDTVYYRPVGNTAHVWGMGLALLVGGMTMSGLVLVGVMMIQWWGTSLELTPGIYLFYWLTVVLPSLVVMIGITFLVTGVFKSQAIGMLAIAGWIGLFVYYAGNAGYGTWDLAGITLPNGFSGITGHPALEKYLLQRFGWLLLGFGFIQLSVFFWERLPNVVSGRRKLLTGMILGLVGCFLLFSYWSSENDFFNRRERYKEIATRYERKGECHVVKHDIVFERRGREIKGESVMSITAGGESREEVVLYLNPGFEVERVETLSGESVGFDREGQVLVVQRELGDKDTLGLRVVYGGEIDEAVGYLDVPDEELKEERYRHTLDCRTGRRFAMVGDECTWLVPEIMWYPMAVPPGNVTEPYSATRDFTRYSLMVKNPGKQTVISQGNRFRRGADLIFRNATPLVGISLCTGNYKLFKMTVDSVDYEFFCAANQASALDVFRKNTKKWKDMIEEWQMECNSNMGKDYPYDRLMMVELPFSCVSYFREWRSGSEFVQPEMICVREKQFVKFLDGRASENAMSSFLSDFLTSETGMRVKRWTNLLRFGITRSVGISEQRANDVSIAPMYFEQLNVLDDGQYPLLGYILNRMEYGFNRTTDLGKRLPLEELNASNPYLKTCSMSEVLKDSRMSPESKRLFRERKMLDLVDRLIYEGVQPGDMAEFLRDFWTVNRWQRVKYPVFRELFQKKYEVNLDSLLERWYTFKGLPEFWVKDCRRKLLSWGEDSVKWQVECTIYNNGNVDGFVNVQVENHLGKEYFRQAMGEKRNPFIDTYYAYLVKAGTGMRVRLTLGTINHVYLNMNHAANLPGYYEINSFHEEEEVLSEKVTREEFLEGKAIIVDNTDAGCRVIRPVPLLERWQYGNGGRPLDLLSSSFMLPSLKWAEVIISDNYGLFRKSAFVRIAGTGETGVEWTVDLKEGGQYELFAFHAFSFPVQEGDCHSYIVYCKDGEEKVDVAVPRVGGWFSLGTYEFESGKNKVYLSDKGHENQWVVADAMKWVKLND